MITEIIGGALSLIGTGLNAVSAYTGYDKINPSYANQLYGNSLRKSGYTSGAYTNNESKKIRDKIVRKNGTGETLETIGGLAQTIGGAVSVTGNILNSVGNAVVKPPKETSGYIPYSNTGVPDAVSQYVDKNSPMNFNVEKELNTVSPSSPPGVDPSTQIYLGGSTRPIVNNPITTKLDTEFKPVEIGKDTLIDFTKYTAPQEATFGDTSLLQSTPSFAKKGMKIESGAKKIIAGEAGKEWLVDTNTGKIIKELNRGAEEVVMPKDTAVLNQEQMSRLNAGEPFETVIASLPDVPSGKTASSGTIGPDDDKHTDWRDMLMGFKHIYDWVPNATKSTATGTKQIINMGKTIFPTRDTTPVFDLSQPKNTKSVYPTHDTVMDRATDIRDMNTRVPEKNMGDPFTPEVTGETETPFGPPLFKSDSVYNDYEDYKTAMFGNGYPTVAKSPKGTSLSDTWDMVKEGKGGGSKLKTTTTKKYEDKTKFKWGSEESVLAANLLGNLGTLSQKSPEKISTTPVRASDVTMITPKQLNAEPYLSDLGRQSKSLLDFYMQTGQTDKVPSLVAGIGNARDKIMESLTSRNAGMQEQALATNASADNQKKLTQAGLDQRTSEQQTALDVERSKIKAAQNAERWKTISNNLLAWGQYSETRKNRPYEEQMRDLVLANLKMKAYGG